MLPEKSNATLKIIEGDIIDLYKRIESLKQEALGAKSVKEASMSYGAAKAFEESVAKLENIRHSYNMEH